MPRGQAHTTWFPEVKAMLIDKWSENLTIPQQFELVKKLNEKLTEIRVENKIKPPMLWCYTCNKSLPTDFSVVTITGMYYALKRFEICSEEEFKELRRVWNRYSRAEGVDIHGKPKSKKVKKSKKSNQSV